MRSVLLCSLLAIGCWSPPDGPVDAYVLTRLPSDSASDAVYSLEVRRLDVETVVPLLTPHFDFRANAIIWGDNIDLGEPLVPNLLDGEPLVAADPAGLIALSAAHNLENAYAFYQGLGLGRDVTEPERLPVLFHPVQGIVYPAAQPLHDNAAYDSTSRVFYLQPNRLEAEALPIELSDFVATHELGHAIFHHLLFVARGQADEESEMGTDYMRALNEGLADTFALGMTSQVDGLSHVIPAERVNYRDPSTRPVLTAELDHQVADGEGDPYAIGAVVAGTFYDYAELRSSTSPPPPELMRRSAELAFQALITFDIATAEHPADFIDYVAATLPDTEDRDLFCQVARAHWAPRLDRLPSCP